LSRLGIRGFKPTLRKADEKLSELRTAEGTLLPENTRAELRRDMTRLRVVREQLKEIEQQRLRKLDAGRANAPPNQKAPDTPRSHFETEIDSGRRWDARGTPNSRANRPSNTDAFEIALGQRHGIHRAGARPGDRLDVEPSVFEQIVEHPQVKAPCEPPPCSARLTLFCPVQSIGSLASVMPTPQQTQAAVQPPSIE
jgi:hypothetical protein